MIRKTNRKRDGRHNGRYHDTRYDYIDQSERTRNDAIAIALLHANQQHLIEGEFMLLEDDHN